MSVLFKYANIADKNLSTLRESSFEAINSWIRNVGEDCVEKILNIYKPVLELLKNAIVIFNFIKR